MPDTPAADTPAPEGDGYGDITTTIDGSLMWIAEAAPDGSAWDVMVIEEGTSANGRRYSADVLKKAAGLFNGQGVYAYEVKPGLLDHLSEGDKEKVGDGGGGVRNLIGALEGARFGEANGKRGVIARLKVVAPWAKQLFKGVWEAGQRQLLGFSIDARARMQQAIDGVLDVIEIAPNPTLDVVSHPAAGGALLRIAASIGESPMPDQTELVPEPAVEKTPAPEPAPVKESTPEPAAPAFDAQAAADEVDRIIATREAVRSGVAASGLPDATKVRLVESLTQRTYESVEDAKAKTDDAIKGERDYLASLGVPKVTGAGSVREAATAGSDKLDRYQVAMDGMFARRDLKLGDEVVPAFNGLHEAAFNITGRVPGIDLTYEEMLKQAAQSKPWRHDPKWSASRESKPALGQGFRRVQEAIISSTFGQILGDSITRKMQADYNLPERQDWRKLVTVENIRDFRTQRRGMLGGYGTLGTVAESANYPSLTSPGDDEETYTISKRGGIERLTIETIANDDMSLVRRIPERLGRAASETLFRAVFDVFTDNGNMYDGVTLFHANHNNTNTNALTAENLRLAIVAMMDQTAYGDTSIILGNAARPKYLLVPHELKHLALSLTAPGPSLWEPVGGATPADANATIPNQQDFVNIEVITVPHWTDANNWFLAADPMSVPGIELGFWQGRSEPELFVADSPTQAAMFDSDNVEYKIRHVYGVKTLDWRGYYRQVVA